MCLSYKQTPCLQAAGSGLLPSSTWLLRSITGFSTQTVVGIEAVLPNRGKQRGSFKSLGSKLKQTKACPCKEGRGKMVPGKVKIDQRLHRESRYCYQ